MTSVGVTSGSATMKNIPYGCVLRLTVVLLRVRLTRIRCECMTMAMQ